MWLEHCYCYFQLVYSAILLKSHKAQVFRYSLLTEYDQDKSLQISNLWRNSFRLLLNFRRRHRLVNENMLIFITVFVTLTKMSELSSQFSSRQRKLKWLRQRKTKKTAIYWYLSLLQFLMLLVGWQEGHWASKISAKIPKSLILGTGLT